MSNLPPVAAPHLSRLSIAQSTDAILPSTLLIPVPDAELSEERVYTIETFRSLALRITDLTLDDSEPLDASTLLKLFPNVCCLRFHSENTFSEYEDVFSSIMAELELRSLDFRLRCDDEDYHGIASRWPATLGRLWVL